MSLNPQTIADGQEQYEFFEVGHLARRGKNATRVQYNYRHTDGTLFSCVARTLEDARAKRDQWLARKAAWPRTSPGATPGLETGLGPIRKSRKEARNPMESYEWKPWGKMTAREYQEHCEYNQKVHEAEDFTRSHPVLVGERLHTTLKQRLERIRDNAHARNRKVRDMAEQYMRKLGYQETEA